MTEVENQTLNLLKNIIENRDKIFESINEAKEKLIPIVNIINILGNTYYEVSNSSLLYNILKIKFKYDKYNNKEINFAKDFSEYIIKEKLGNDSVNINSSNISVYSEEHPSIESKRRMDLFIQSDNFEIIIENKIGAGDQPNQLQDYYSNRINENKIIKDNIFVVYLTRYGYKPSEFSIDKKLISDLEKENKIYYLSHDDMANWIEDKILNNKEYEFLKEQKYQSIYSALIQIRDNEKFITKETEENKVEQKITEDFLNLKSLINEGEPIKDSFDKLNKFYELLENAQKVISNKRLNLVSRDIEYYSYIRKIVEEYKTNKGIYANIISKELVSYRFSSGDSYSLNIDIPIGKNNDIRIILDQRLDYHLCISVFSEKPDIINQLKYIDKIKNKITKILNNCIEGESSEYGSSWVYLKFIDTTKKDEAEDIADKIIELYEFLRDNIKLDNA